MNKYNTIHLDISSAWDFHKDDLIDFVHKRICEDLKKEFQDFDSYWKNTSSFASINTFITMNYEVSKAFQMA